MTRVTLAIAALTMAGGLAVARRPQLPLKSPLSSSLRTPGLTGTDGLFADHEHLEQGWGTQTLLENGPGTMADIGTGFAAREPRGRMPIGNGSLC
jgi:hypothetical protein